MKMLIGGKWVDAKDKRTIEIRNPATHELIDRVPRADRDDVAEAVEIARRGLQSNRSIPARDRHAYLTRLSELIRSNHDRLRDMMIRENGKSFAWASFEISKTAEIIATVADRAKDPQGSSYPMDAMNGCSNQMAFVYRQPRGVVGGIIPFNFPAEMLAYKLGGALAAGNSIVVKLSEDCPLTCLAIGGLALEAGLPAEAFHLLPGYGNEAGAALVDHPDVPMITFTGSSGTGMLIMERAARYLKHLSLELGGNDPVVVFDDADIDAVAANLVNGRMTVGNGQACVADKRFIVDRKVLPELLVKCEEIVKSLRVGDPVDPAVDVGPLITEAAARKVEEQIEQTVAMGARLVVGGTRFDKTFIAPALVTDVTSAMPLFREECFGPVAPFTAFESEEEAVQLANDSKYGLQGAVYSKDISRALRVADALEVGGVVINASSCFRPGNVPYMPRKLSGIGTDNMYSVYDEMTTGKAIVIHDAMRTYRS